MRLLLIATLTMAGMGIVNPAHAGIAGDANCDGTVDERDVAALIDRLFTLSDCGDGDANQDGVISAADLPALLPRARATGPTVTFLGLASAGGDVVAPSAISDEGFPIFVRPVGVGFKVIVEGAVGPSGKSVGRVTNVQVGRPDLQIESQSALGDGSFDRCPRTVPGVDPPNFGPDANIDQALQAFACSFDVITTRASACTLDSFGNSNWAAAMSQIQFCVQIESSRQFPLGQTRLSARLRDLDGNLGPMQSVVIQIGNAPPATRTRTNSPTATITATVTTTLSATRTATMTTRPTASPTVPIIANTHTPTTRPTGTVNSSGTVTPSPTRTTTSRTPPSRTATASATAPLPSPTSTGTGTATVLASFTATPRNPSASPTFTRTNSPSPTRTSTAAGSPSVTPTRSSTATRTASATPFFSATASPTRTRTPTATPSPTPTVAVGAGPAITFFGVANANDTVATPIATATAGIPIYRAALGFGFTLVVEARSGPNGRPAGSNAFNTDPADPTARPNLQIEVNQALGDGSPAVCDNNPPAGGVPAVNPPDFSVTQTVSDALNDLGCRFEDGMGRPSARGSTDACTLFSDGSFGFVCSKTTNPGCTHGASTLQFCGQISRALTFKPGDTLVTVRVTDTAGNPGQPAQLIIRR